MQSLNFYIKKIGATSYTQINPPQNAMDMELEVSFMDPTPLNTLNAQRLTFVADEAAYINFWLNSANGGMFQAIPLQIIESVHSRVVFDGIIDLGDVDNEFTIDMVKVKIMNYQLEMFTELLASLSFAYLAAPISNGGPSVNVNGDTNGRGFTNFPAKGAIIPLPEDQGGDYVPIAYQLSSVPDYTAAALTAFAIFQLVVDIVQGIQLIISSVAQFVGSVADIWEFGIGQILYAVIQTIYVILLSLAALKLTETLFSQLVSPVLTKFGMRVSTLLTRACEYFGIGFSSSIFSVWPYSDLVVMPAKRAWSQNETFTQRILNFSFSFGNNSGSSANTSVGAGGGGGNAGLSDNTRMEFDDLYNCLYYQQNSGIGNAMAAYGYYEGTPQQLFEDIGKVFNARPKIITGGAVPTLFFEVEESFLVNPVYVNPNYILPPISNQTPFNRLDSLSNKQHSNSKWKTNASELVKYYDLTWNQDTSDNNTYNYYDGTNAEVTLNPGGIAAGNYSMLRGLADVRIPFALIKRKQADTFPEKLFANIFSFAATLINPLINFISGLVSAVNSVISAINSIINDVNNLLNLVGINKSAPTIPTISFNPTQIPTSFAFSKVGHALMEQHITSEPKLFIVGPQQFYPQLNFGDWGARSFNAYTIHEDNRKLLSASYLMQNFHYSKLAISVDPGGNPWFNQWQVFEDLQIPLDSGQYFSLFNYNQFKDQDGDTCVITSCKWNTYKGIATITYRKHKEYATNMSNTIVVDGVYTYASLSQLTGISYSG